MKKAIISLLLLSSLHLYSEDVVVSPSQDFQSYLDGLNNNMMGYLDYYLYDFQIWFQVISSTLGEDSSNLLAESMQQTEKLQSLIDNVIDYVEPQLEEIRSNSSDEIVPTIKAIETKQKEISTDVKDIAIKVDSGFTTANDGISDISTTLDNLYTLQEDRNENDENFQQGQKEYYDSLEAAVNHLQQTLTEDVGPNIYMLSDNVESIAHLMNSRASIGFQVEILNAIGTGNGILDDILFAVNSLSSSSNGFPQEILDDYKKIDRDGEILELGWKSSLDADQFQPGNLTLTKMEEEKIEGGYFEQILKLLKTHTKVDVQSKETLLMILKTLNQDNSSKANEFVESIGSENYDALRDEQAAVDTDSGVKLSDNDKYKSQLTKIKDTAQDLVSHSSNFNQAPGNVFLFLRANGQTYNTQYDLPLSFTQTITTVHDSMPWIYGLIIFGSLSGLFFYLLGILYQVITHYKVV